MEKFAVGMRIRINYPAMPEHGICGQITKEIQPGWAHGVFGTYHHPTIYTVDLDGMGRFDYNGQEYAYAAKFLEGVPPELKPVEKSSWKEFDYIIGGNLANTITG